MSNNNKLPLTGGRILRLARLVRQMTLDEVAVAYGGISRDTLSRWERGVTAAPFDDVRGIVEDVLKFKLVELIGVESIHDEH
ncbi:hypothetical protein N473_15715 [Pseudoalteromonas luteoviolacea CPMOR-1]|uniref:HTH cro/C1-type domain-containing protein n=1 Tax=Pseudoalteromonas luteoviolacea CPMOR-1 TaxID=1365248 RepID=A0A167L7S0_9GAMM|nr:helix-turn-helix transcriptional regulator [Pseudoalteromonas luteoviolacea]KZN64047.1 hypothetical protein N473_15715 [Pseudoalteromonas luteoviolacea CPMOR-1]